MTILYILLGLTAVFFGISYVCYFLAFRSPQNKQNDFYNLPDDEQYQAIKHITLPLIAGFEKIPYEDVFIGEKGRRLHARYYHKTDGGVVDIAFHGYRGTGVRDLCGGSEIGLSLGHNLLLVDQRAHGLSDGHTIAFGIEEKFDCLDWVNYVIDRFGADTRIVLYGVSMGATTILMASGLQLPENVLRIIADSPYDSPKDIIKTVIGKMGFPVNITYFFAQVGARLFGGFSLNAPPCSELVKRSTIPTLIIHGEDDRFVPMAMSEIIAVENPEYVRRVTFKDAGHGLSFVVAHDRYTEIAKDFMRV